MSAGSMTDPIPVAPSLRRPLARQLAGLLHGTDDSVVDAADRKDYKQIDLDVALRRGLVSMLGQLRDGADTVRVPLSVIGYAGEGRTQTVAAFLFDCLSDPETLPELVDLRVPDPMARWRAPEILVELVAFLNRLQMEAQLELDSRNEGRALAPAA